MIRPGAGRNLAPWAEDRRPSLGGAGEVGWMRAPSCTCLSPASPQPPRELLGTQSSGTLRLSCPGSPRWLRPRGPWQVKVRGLSWCPSRLTSHLVLGSSGSVTDSLDRPSPPSSQGLLHPQPFLLRGSGEDGLSPSLATPPGASPGSEYSGPRGRRSSSGEESVYDCVSVCV